LPSRYRDSIKTLQYRVASLAVCIGDSPRGRECRDELAHLKTPDPEYIQFGSADWFRLAGIVRKHRAYPEN